MPDIELCDAASRVYLITHCALRFELFHIGSPFVYTQQLPGNLHAVLLEDVLNFLGNVLRVLSGQLMLSADTCMRWLTSKS